MMLDEEEQSMLQELEEKEQDWGFEENGGNNAEEELND